METTSTAPCPHQLPRLDTVSLTPVDACNLCGSRDRDPLLHVRHWTSGTVGAHPIHSVVCRRCGLIYLAQTLPIEVLEHPGKHGGSTAYGLDMTDARCEENYRRLYKKMQLAWPFIEPHLGSLRDKRVLDVLCGSGGVVGFCAEQGAHAEGLDPSPQQSRWAVEKRGLAIHPRRLDQFGVTQENRYGFVTGLQMLNHYADASGVLTRLHDILQPDGLLFIEVLNFAHALSRKPLKGCLHVDHPYLFTPSSLLAYVRTHGFSVVAFEVDSDKRHEFGSMNHMHLLCRRVEERPPLDPSPTAAVDAKTQCLLSFTQFVDAQLARSAAPLATPRNKRKLIKRLKSGIAAGGRRIGLLE